MFYNLISFNGDKGKTFICNYYVSLRFTPPYF